MRRLHNSFMSAHSVAVKASALVFPISRFYPLPVELRRISLESRDLARDLHRKQPS
jgi:hypothetical protein